MKHGHTLRRAAIAALLIAFAGCDASTEEELEAQESQATGEVGTTANSDEEPSDPTLQSGPAGSHAEPAETQESHNAAEPTGMYEPASEPSAEPSMNYGSDASAGEEDEDEEFFEGEEKFEAVGTNPFVLTSAQPTSTFASDSDTASYDIFRQAIEGENLPDPDSVRLEEFVNSFDYTYDPPEADSPEPFRVQLETAPSPFTPGADLLRIGIQGKTPVAEEMHGANLVFLIDVSGSMSSAAKLPLVKALLNESLLQLAPNDRVSIVTYAGSVGVKLPSTSASDVEAISEAIDSLDASGSTAGGAGIELAYEQAAAGFIEGGINHVVLCTDGDFNVGVSSTSGLVELIEEKRKTGITLTVLGFGKDNLNDKMMEKLSNAGNGVYGVIVNSDDAVEYAANDLLATMNFIAKDVKIQLEINSDYVYAYRQLGYENRQLEAWQFYDDATDAGEIPAGHAVTALYELIPVGISLPSPEGAPALMTTEGHEDDLSVASEELVLVKIRYKDRDASEEDPSYQINTATPATSIEESFEGATGDLQWAAAVAAFAEILKESPYAQPELLDEIIEIIEANKGEANDRHEFAGKLESAAELLE